MRRLLPIALAALVAGCGGSSKQSEPTRTSTTTGCRTVETPPARGGGGQKRPSAGLDPAKKYALVVQTNCGTFVISLDQKLAPRTTASLVSLARHGFFDRTIFHRIVPGFVIQGGDPTQTGSGGPGYTTIDRPPADASYVKGVVAMAKTATEPAGASGSQFFVVTGADAGLPPDYAIVGRVVKGLGVVDRIGRLGNEAEQPTQAVEIEHVRVVVS